MPVYNSQAWYWVKQDSVSLNNGKSSVALYTAPPQGGSFLLDSGSPGMLLSPELGEAIATSLGGERIPHVTGDWAYSCNCVCSLAFTSRRLLLAQSMRWPPRRRSARPSTFDWEAALSSRSGPRRSSFRSADSVE